MDDSQAWARFRKRYFEFPTLELSLDLSCIDFEDDYWRTMHRATEKAFDAMQELEAGGVANPDESRMVGHYWLRNPQLAPRPELTAAITDALDLVKRFSAEVLGGDVRGKGGEFEQLLVIGIGGSALGPQFVSQALTTPGKCPLGALFFDNTDPDGMDRVLGQLEGKLGRTLCIVISKSGGTKETRNGMLEAKAAYEKVGLSFAQHAVAVTGVGSALDQTAERESWLRRFPMWDWVGGRTSETSAVGLLPAALQGVDVDELLAGARACDEVTRQRDVLRNPAAQLALMWHFVGSGRGDKDMVVLPYKDRLSLFTSYLQQLVMESIGKKEDLDGRIVHQGLVVYGNKGSTDQHAYVQQLVDGTFNFFVTFIEVLRDRDGESLEVEPGVTSGDYLSGFLLGTRRALTERQRESITLTIERVTPFSIGVLIALYERAVGLYATLINTNAYHQPGVEAGKKAATSAIELQGAILDQLAASPGPATADQIAAAIGQPDEAVTVFKICQHLSRNRPSVKRGAGEGATTVFSRDR
jgi:glucose-6-phosphate isomerase